MTTQDIVQLPHQQIGHLEGDDLKSAIERNFKEVAHMLHILQLYEKATGKPINSTVTNSEMTAEGVLPTSKLSEKMVGLLNELQLADGAVTANKLDVNELSAITANLGSVTAGTIETSVVITSLNNHNANESPHNLPSYCKMQADGFKVYDGVNNLRCHLGQYVAGRYGLYVVGKNAELTIDEWGINPDFMKRFANKIVNSGFEKYDEATLKPLYWEGNGIVTSWSNWDGTVSLKLTPGQYMEQGMLDGITHAGANPEWWDTMQTRVSFKHRGGMVRVRVKKVSDNTSYVLTDNSGGTEITGSYIDYGSVANWPDGHHTFYFVPDLDGGKVKVCFENLDGSADAYLDAVQIEPDFTGKWPGFYTYGPRSDALYTQAKVGGKNLWVQNTAPTAIATGDIWIDTA